MLAYLLRRFAASLAVLALVSLGTFMMVHLVPGDPVRAMLGEGGQTTAEDIEQMRRQLGLDRPLPVQYLDYVTRAVRGDFGQSIDHGRELTWSELVLAQQPAALVGIGGGEAEGDGVAGEDIPERVTLGCPLLTDDPDDLVARPVGPRPGRQRLLHGRVEELFGGRRAFEGPEVDASQGGRPLERGEVTEGNAGAAPVHRDEQGATGSRVERVRPPEELEAVHSWQAEIGRQQGHLVALATKLLKGTEAGLS